MVGLCTTAPSMKLYITLHANDASRVINFASTNYTLVYCNPASNTSSNDDDATYIEYPPKHES